MCLLERREATISPLNMTLAARLYPQNSCVEVGVPLNTWSSIACCPNCRREVRVTLAHSCGKHAPPSPLTPQLFPPMCLPQSPFYPPDIQTQQEELRRLANTSRLLRLSGWYYRNLDWQGARNLLKEAGVGTFLIRESGDSKFYFSLSIQTERGPTSVRLHFEHGFFRLDCDKQLARYMPRFRCVMDLVQHYTRVGQRGLPGTMWVDREGCPHSPVLLKTPLRKSPTSLLHSARLAIHKNLDSNPLTPKLWSAPKHRLLPVPPALIEYLGEYPYSM